MIQNAIRRLVRYGLQTGLVEKEDEIYTTNRLIELFGLDSPEVQGEQAGGAAENGAEASGNRQAEPHRTGRKLPENRLTEPQRKCLWTQPMRPAIWRKS